MSDEPVYDGRKEAVQIGSFGGIYFRRIGPLAKGTVMEGHTHHADHITALATGSVRVRYRNGERGAPFKSAVFIAPINFEVKAELYHEITALEDGTMYQCLFWDADGGDIPMIQERSDG